MLEVGGTVEAWGMVNVQSSQKATQSGRGLAGCAVFHYLRFWLFDQGMIVGDTPIANPGTAGHPSAEVSFMTTGLFIS